MQPSTLQQALAAVQGKLLLNLIPLLQVNSGYMHDLTFPFSRFTQYNTDSMGPMTTPHTAEAE